MSARGNGVAKAVRHKNLFNFMIKGASHSLSQPRATLMPQQNQPHKTDGILKLKKRQGNIFASLIVKCPDLADYQFPAGKFFVLEILYSKSLKQIMIMHYINRYVKKVCTYMHKPKDFVPHADDNCLDLVECSNKEGPGTISISSREEDPEPWTYL